MKKLLIILGSLLAVVLIGAFIASFFLGSIVTKGVNRFGPGITGTTVALDTSSISPLSGTGTLHQLTVGNPPGWRSEKAFSFDKVHLDLEPRSLLGDHVIVNEMVIEGPEFVYETKIITSNLREILNNIEKSIGGGGAGKPSDQPQPTTKEGKPLKFTVKNFRLENARVTIGFGSNVLTAQMPALILSDLGTKEGGLTASELATQVIRRILADITGTVAAAALKSGAASGAAGVDAATEAAKQAGDSLKKIFSGAEKESPK